MWWRSARSGALSAALAASFLAAPPEHTSRPLPLPLPAGELREYVGEEVNVRSLTPCADPMRYCTVRALPEFQALGKRLGKAMAAVAKGVAALGVEVSGR